MNLKTILQLGWLLTGILAISLACTIPSSSNGANDPTPAPIVWWTNTPESEPAVQSTRVPDAPTEEPDEVLVPTPTVPPTASPHPDTDVVDTSPYLYEAQAGDTVYALSVRFSVLPQEITSPGAFSGTGLLPPGQLFIIPRRLVNTTASEHLIPDSETVYSPSVTGFDTDEFVASANGYLNTYEQYLGTTGWTSGADIVERVALENSVNPRLLLSLLQWRAGWVYGYPQDNNQRRYPMGLSDPNKDGLYEQLSYAVEQLSIGYYGWREGLITDIAFTDGERARLAPDLNAGSVAVMYYLAQVSNSVQWAAAIDPETGIAQLHFDMFGSPWIRAGLYEPLYPPILAQPELILPFAPEQIWSYTGGPHGAWGRLGSRAAIDFAPGSVESGCVDSDNWVVAAAPGLVVRTAPGVVVLDLDGDGLENTGWVVLYLHIATEKKIPVGTWVTAGQFLGNPSCEGGFSTGTHIHIARKYNGEWMAAGGPVPFVLSGWIAVAGNAPYEGALVRGDEKINASPLGTFATRITRERNEP